MNSNLEGVQRVINSSYSFIKVTTIYLFSINQSSVHTLKRAHLARNDPIWITLWKKISKNQACVALAWPKSNFSKLISHWPRPKVVTWRHSSIPSNHILYLITTWVQRLVPYRILRMQEAGLTDYWTRKYRPAPNNCNDLSHSGASLERSLNLLDLQSAFLILAIGLSLASLAFVCENLIHYIRKWILVT